MDLNTKMRTILEEIEHFGLLKQNEGNLESRNIQWSSTKYTKTCMPL
jgi:hypothetical protein